MNNKSLLFNIILAVAVVILFILHFTCGESCNAPAATEGQKTTEIKEAEKPEDKADFSDIEVKAADRQSGKILVAYINEDSLANRYEYAVEIRDRIEKNTNQAKGRVESRMRSLEQEVQKIEEKFPTMYKDEQMKVQQDFAEKEQNLMRYQQQEEEKVMKFQETEFKKYNEFTRGAVEELAKKMGYDLILIKKPGASFIYINEGFDITEEVVSYLNQEYKKRKSNKAK